MYDWQLWCTLNHYRVKPDAKQDPDYLAGDPDAIPIRTEAFHYRRSQIIAPQKTGKGPWSAAWVAASARARAHVAELEGHTRAVTYLRAVAVVAEARVAAEARS